MIPSEFDAAVAQLRALYLRLRGDMRARWNRDLPLDEMLFDRWERAVSLGFGQGASIYHSSYVYGDVTVGERTWIGPFTVLDGSGGLTIGRSCSISTGVQIYTHDTVSWALTDGKAPAQHAPVTIGDCCYLGPNVVVTARVTIGTQRVIGAGALGNRDVPDRAIVHGLPGRVVGRVEVDGGEVKLVYDRDAG